MLHPIVPGDGPILGTFFVAARWIREEDELGDICGEFLRPLGDFKLLIKIKTNGAKR